ncbi:MAG: hypothetical protein U0V64_13900 [Cyclobacteriaceae bacterium]
METRDLLITPAYLAILFAIAFWLRPYFTDSTTYRYFFPAFTFKVIGALALGFIYTFYYHGGDTFNFHTHGSRHIWDAFVDSPDTGLSMMFSDGKHQESFYRYSSRIFFFGDKSSFFLIRIAAFFDLFTFSTYSSTALFFAVFSFLGSWMLFTTFYKRYPEGHFLIAIACLFVPSMVLWGSGLLKDTIVMSALGMMTYCVDYLFNQRKWSLFYLLVLLLGLYLVFSLKKFVLQAYLPAALFWVYLTNVQRLRSAMVRILALPIIVILLVAGAYYSVVRVGEGDQRYSLDKIAETARITAIDIRYQSGKDAGSGYTLGTLDGTFASMLRLSPQAINVTLFRPYLWEVRNPLMLMSALESTAYLVFVLIIIYRCGFAIFRYINNPDVLFTMVFSLVYAFAVGVSTFNFGTLSRYKTPLMPFFLIGLIVVYLRNKPENVASLDRTE